MSPTKVTMILIILSAPLILFLLSGCQTTPTQPAQVTPTIIAQPVLRCAPVDDVIKFLRNKFNESPIYSGVYENKIILTIFLNKETKSFTVTHTASAITCLVSSGNNFKELVWDEKSKSVKL